MLVAMVNELHRHRSTGRMEIYSTWAAMIREPISPVPTSITIKETFWIYRLGLEMKGVCFVEFMLDLLRQFIAFAMEEEIARCADVNRARSLSLAGGTVGIWAW